MARPALVLVASVLATTFVACVCVSDAAHDGAGSDAQWVWCDAAGLKGLHGGVATPNPANAFVYFRTEFTLQSAVDAPTLRLAADSNAALWVNGVAVRLKVTRYNESDVRAEIVSPGRLAPLLKAPGQPNTIVALLFSWGNIETFQRTGQVHAGLWISSNLGVATSAASGAWRCLLAPEHMQQTQQIIGIGGAHRIRYPQVIDGRNAIKGDVFAPAFDDGSWGSAVEVTGGPWAATPPDVETVGATIGPLVTPYSVVAAGTLDPIPPLDLSDAWNMANRVANATYNINSTLTRIFSHDLGTSDFSFTGTAGSSHYVTFDFAVPTHGYPRVTVTGATSGTVVDFGYTEKALDLYTGDAYVLPSGWINPIGIVGHGLGDRYITSGADVQTFQLPDERTARWLVLQVTFPDTLPTATSTVKFNVSINRIGFPVEPQLGSFESGDPVVDGGIVRLALEHVKVAMSDVLTDTPGREDGQWIEDARPRGKIAARWFGNRGLRRVLIREQAEAQRSNGAMHPFAPSNYPAWPAPYDWAVQWVAAMHDDYMWRGETDLIQLYWTQLTRFWDNCLSHVDPTTGLWLTSQVLADIRVGVHCPNNQCTSGIVTPWIIERLQWSAAMAAAVGNTTMQMHWNGTAALMTKAFRTLVVVPANATLPAHVPDIVQVSASATHPSGRAGAPTLTASGYSQAGQSVAVYAGLLSGDDAAANLQYAFPPPAGSPPRDVTRWNNPTYMYRALSALSYAGMTERAVAHLKERYAQYLPGTSVNPVPSQFQGPYGGPLPEYWVSRVDRNLSAGELDTAQPQDGSGSHGWCGVALLWMSESLLGVTIASPGGGKLAVAPDRRGLPYVCGASNTPKGVVLVCWNKSPGVLEVTTPASTSTTVSNPPTCADGSAVAGEGEHQPRDDTTACRLKLTSGDAAHVAPTSSGGFVLTQGGSFAFACAC